MSKRRIGKHVETDDPYKFGHTGLSFRRQYADHAPTSWWTKVSTREEFQQLARSELRRMAQSRFAKTERDAL